MASRGSKKSPAVRTDKRELVFGEINERWRKKSRKFVVAGVILIVLLLVLSMPFAWNGTISLSIEGEMSIEASGPLWDIIASGSDSDSVQTTEMSVDLPVNPWMVTFAPTFCNGADTFFVVEALKGMGVEYDRSAGYLDNPMNLDAGLLDSMNRAGIAYYVISVLLVVGMLVMVVLCILAMAGKVKAKAAFIAALMFTVLTVVQFIFGAAMCSTKISMTDSSGTAAIVPGVFMFLAPVFGAALSAVTGVWAKKCDGDRAEYLQLKAELEKR